MIRFRADVRILAIDNKDMPTFIVMMKALNLPFTIATNGSGLSLVSVHDLDISHIQTEWESRGQTFSIDKRK